LQRDKRSSANGPRAPSKQINGKPLNDAANPFTSRSFWLLNPLGNTNDEDL